MSTSLYSPMPVLGAPPSKLSAENRLGEENKGHQLLMKMGMLLSFFF